MQIVRNPWRDEFFTLVSESKRSIKLLCPYVKNKIAQELFIHKSEKVSITLTTSFKLNNYYSGASDLDALESIIQHRGAVLNYQNLHAKVFIFDDEKAIVTSANLTSGGLSNNYEYGILIQDNQLVNEILLDYEKLLSSELAAKVGIDNIETARSIIAKAPSRPAIAFPDIDLNDSYRGGIQSIADTLSPSGWRRDVFDCLVELPNDYFSLNDLYGFLPRFQLKYPMNNTIKDSLRRNLQELRAIGLLEFLGGGNYRKLWSDNIVQ